MSWNDFYERRDVINAVLRQAEQNPDGPLPFTTVPNATKVFRDEAELLAALQYKWMQRLTGLVSVALNKAQRSPDVDSVEAVATAWRKLAVEERTLRRLLDEFGGAELREAQEREQRMLALAAGLADPLESTTEVNRIGAAFLTLIRSTPFTPAPRRSPMQQLLRRLAPSA